jgi:proteic killer suppression protein
MIRSFADSDTESVFNRDPVGRWSPEVRRAALRKLLIIDAAASLEDLRVPPGNRLEKLRGLSENTYSIRVNDQWRIVFIWDSGDADDVQIVDYH